MLEFDATPVSLLWSVRALKDDLEGVMLWCQLLGVYLDTAADLRGTTVTASVARIENFSVLGKW
jgi:hypothetical protein